MDKTSETGKNIIFCLCFLYLMFLTFLSFLDDGRSGHADPESWKLDGIAGTSLQKMAARVQKVYHILYHILLHVDAILVLP